MAEAMSMSTATPDLAGGGPQTDPAILVVEDEVLVRSAAAAYLRGVGFRVLEAVDVDEAARLLASERSIAVVFADVKLPGGRSGSDLARLIRQDCPEVKVLLTSGVVQALDDGIEGVALLKKPYFLFDVERRIRALLAGPSLHP
jgi:CheY-like chemotaxis protein